MFGVLILIAAGLAGLYYYQYRQALSQQQTGEPANALPAFPDLKETAEQLPVIGQYFVNLDGVKRIAKAIEFAEGGTVPGSRPFRNNNPGDLTTDIGGNDIHPIGYDGPYAVYATYEDGLADLEQQVIFWLTSRSKVAGPHDTIYTLSRKYTTTEQDGWANNVASYLGVPTSTKLSELA